MASETPDFSNKTEFMVVAMTAPSGVNRTHPKFCLQVRVLAEPGATSSRSSAKKPISAGAQREAAQQEPAPAEPLKNSDRSNDRVLPSPPGVERPAGSNRH